MNTNFNLLLTAVLTLMASIPMAFSTDNTAGTQVPASAFAGSMQITFSGINDGTCTDCGNANGSFTLVGTNGTSWTVPKANRVSLCNVRDAGPEMFYSGGSVIVDFAGGHYEKAGTPPLSGGSITVNLVSRISNCCKGNPGSLTITGL